jgi:hypothetical protein
LGGGQGIGKDTILEPVKQAIGAWNFEEAGPQQMLGQFNGFAKCVILRPSEARDLGDLDDRRHYDAWSNSTKEHFDEDYWNELWRWYESGGYAHVAAFLRNFDLASFDPKAPPPKTSAFRDIVGANCAPEETYVGFTTQANSEKMATISNASSLIVLFDKSAGGERLLMGITCRQFTTESNGGTFQRADRSMGFGSG